MSGKELNRQEAGQGKNYAFFSHRDCEFFPCHPVGAGGFNCLFCYCPLYAMGDDCGGDFIRLESGVKSCENCGYPHRPENYSKIIERLSEWGRSV